LNSKNKKVKENRKDKRKKMGKLRLGLNPEIWPTLLSSVRLIFVPPRPRVRPRRQAGPPCQPCTNHWTPPGSRSRALLLTPWSSSPLREQALHDFNHRGVSSVVIPHHYCCLLILSNWSLDSRIGDSVVPAMAPPCCPWHRRFGLDGE
jgi:hypothetical protein